MDCLTCREALSARLDGEAEPVPPSATDEHLHGCADCRAWHDRAAELSRTLRVRAAIDVPDLSAVILENAPVPVRGWWPRLALGGVAVAQLALALAQVFGVGSTVAHGGGHLFNESTAWNLAIGVGLFWAVFQRRAVAGLIPVLSGFVALLLVYSTYDLVTGAVPVSRVLGHGLLVAGLVLLVVIHRRHGDPTPSDGVGSDTRSDTVSGAIAATDAPATGESTSDRRPPLRPAGHHRAA